MARSSVAPRSSASSPMKLPSPGSSGPSCSNRMTSGPSNAPRYITLESIAPVGDDPHRQPAHRGRLTDRAHPGDRPLDRRSATPRLGTRSPGRRDLAECFVRPFIVVESEEGIEASLLSRRSGSWWMRRLRLEGAMQPFVPAILLRAARFDPLQADAELQPPHCQPAQSARSRAAERRSIVGPNGVRQTVFTQQPVDHRLHAGAGRRHDPASQQVAAMSVTHRKGIATPTIGCPEPALEVHAPCVVRRVDRPERLALGQGRAMAAAALHQALAAQKIADRTGCRPHLMRHALCQDGTQLERPPARMGMPQLQDRQDSVSRQTVRHSERSV